MSVSIQVAVRCRPFVCDDELGVSMFQNSEDEGEINLLRAKYSTKRFAFSWSWWSAYGYKNHCKSQESKDEADSMKLIDQTTVYGACGEKIKKQLFDGNAVVLFAYGLSGSGKTFTVFGPDAADIPEAWFKHATPHPLWGIFPHLGYDTFQEKGDTWKIKMKYFQNVVDIVRDLMSPVAQEQNYKQGMRKDKDGFTDINWCSEMMLNSWDDLRNTFLSANGRKAIAPTQFNPQSTRGHCIMTLEVEKPKKDDPTTKQRGRVYVCDLAGTEPAGDVVYALYKKKKMQDGSIENQFQGAHPDKSKTKQLQDQGKKINLSLSEMAQFFMKMAAAIKKKKLKAGQSIPGCNSYFLCKYLKDTMLQARTYLFCAIRPEVKFHPYTFSTLGFAKNASVIKLQPKKATTAMSPKERKLMQELEAMKLKFEEMMKGGGGGGGGNTAEKDEEIKKLQEMLAAKSEAMVNEMNKADGPSESDALLERQKQEYGRRGIIMTAFGDDIAAPYFLNLDEDEFRSERFMYVLDRDVTEFGKDIRPTNFAIKAGHCTVKRAGDDITLVCGEGETYHNGKKLEKGEEVKLNVLDRVGMATDLMVLRFPGQDAAADAMSTEDMVLEFQNAKMSSADSAAMKQIEEERKQFEEERKKFQAEMEKMKLKASEGGAQAAKAQQEMEEMKAKQEAEQRKMQDTVNRQQMLELIPQVDESNHLLQMLNRNMLFCEAMLRVGLSEDGEFSVPQVKVKVSNKFTDDVIYLDPFEFKKVWQVMKDEIGFLRGALSDGTEYYANEFHDPMAMLYNHSYEIGTAILFVESLVYMLDTDDEERHVQIKNVGDPHNEYGSIEVVWTPLGSQDEDEEVEVPDISSPEELLGKPWNFKIEIIGISKLPVQTERTYCQYEFFGQQFTTDVVDTVTNHPHFNYSYIHHVDEVTQEFIDYLSTKSVTIHVFVDPYVSSPPKDKIASTNKTIAKNLGFVSGGDDSDLRAENANLRTQIDKLMKENDNLRKKVAELSGQPSVVAKLQNAKETDNIVNG